MNLEDLPTFRLTMADFLSLEDRSSCLGAHREPGQHVRCNLDLLTGGSRWTVVEFVEDKEVKRLAKYWEAQASMNPGLKSFLGLADDPRLRLTAKFYRAEVVDGTPQPQSLDGLLRQLAWLKAGAP